MRACLLTIRKLVLCNRNWLSSSQTKTFHFRSLNQYKFYGPDCSEFVKWFNYLKMLSPTLTQKLTFRTQGCGLFLIISLYRRNATVSMTLDIKFSFTFTPCFIGWLNLPRKKPVAWVNFNAKHPLKYNGILSKCQPVSQKNTQKNCAKCENHASFNQILTQNEWIN